MNVLTGTEEVTLENVETTIEKTAAGFIDADLFTGLAREIQTEINRLVAAREEATRLESGLTTKAELNRASKKARALMNTTRKSLNVLYGLALAKKNVLVATIGETQKDARKAKLEEEAARIAKELAELNAAEKLEQEISEVLE